MSSKPTITTATPRPMKDLLGDWRRWTAIERSMGTALLVLMLVGAPIAVVIDVKAAILTLAIAPAAVADVYQAERSSTSPVARAASDTKPNGSR
jgi:hypothetical protein